MRRTTRATRVNNMAILPKTMRERPAASSRITTGNPRKTRFLPEALLAWRNSDPIRKSAMMERIAGSSFMS